MSNWQHTRVSSPQRWPYKGMIRVAKEQSLLTGLELGQTVKLSTLMVTSPFECIVLDWDENNIKTIKKQNKSKPHLSMYLFIYLSIYLPIYLSIYLYIYLSIGLSAAYLSIYMHLFIHSSIHISLHPSIPVAIFWLPTIFKYMISK